MVSAESSHTLASGGVRPERSKTTRSGWRCGGGSAVPAGRSAADRRPAPCRRRRGSRRPGRAADGCRGARLAGDPAAGAVGGGDLAVEAGPVLPDHERPAAAHGMQPRLVDPLRLGPQQAAGDVDARRAQRLGAAGERRDGDRRRRRRPGCTPASSSAVVQAPVRPVCEHGSRVTTAVPPRARSPASRSATTSACGPPAKTCQPSPAISPSAHRGRRSPRPGWGSPWRARGRRASMARRIAAASTLSGTRHCRLTVLRRRVRRRPGCAARPWPGRRRRTPPSRRRARWPRPRRTARRCLR